MPPLVQLSTDAPVVTFSRPGAVIFKGALVVIKEKDRDIDAILNQLPLRRRTPVSTYRLQFHKGFGFKEAQGLLPYLANLGIADCYASPILKAHPGSLHGYDICDHNALNPELGSEEDFKNFVEELKVQKMGMVPSILFPITWVLIPRPNPWWHDVLENGRHSLYADYFDIYWDPIFRRT